MGLYINNGEEDCGDDDDSNDNDEDLTMTVTLTMTYLLLLLRLLQRSIAVQVRSSVWLMPENQPSGRGLLSNPTAWSPYQHHAAMFWAGLKDMVWGLVSLSALTQAAGGLSLTTVRQVTRGQGSAPVFLEHIYTRQRTNQPTRAISLN